VYAEIMLILLSINKQITAKSTDVTPNQTCLLTVISLERLN